MAVTHDNTQNTSSSGTTFSLNNFVVASQSNRVLLIFVWILNPVTVVSASYNGVAATFLAGVTNPTGERRVECWYLLAPATGTHNISVTLSGSSAFTHISASSVYDVVQTAPTSHTNSANAGTSPSDSITSSTNGIVYDGVTDNNTITVDGSQTQNFQNGGDGSSRKAGSGGSLTMQWSGAGSWAQILVNLAPTDLKTATPGVASLTLTTFAPTVTVTLPANGTVMSPGPWGLIELTSDDSIPPIPLTPQPAMWAVLYDSDDNAIGGLPQLLPGTNITEGCNRLGLATLAVPRRSTGVDLATITTQIGIWRSGEGEIFRGYINNRKRAVASDGTRVINFDITDLGDELLRENCWRGIRLEDVVYQDGLDTIFANMTDWTITSTGVFPNLTKVFDNQNIVEILNEVSAIGNAYWRIRPTTRTVEIIQTPDDSGMVLANLQQGSIDSGIGIIASLDEVSENAEELFNIIAPESKADGEILLSLKDSSRTTPYTILDQFITFPGIVDIQGDGGSTTENPLQIPVVSDGDNRVMIMVIRYGMVDSHALTSIGVGGRPMINTVTGIGGPEGDGHFQQGYGIKNPPKGEQAITMQAVDPADDIATWAVAISLRDTEQPFEAPDIFAYQEVTGTGSANTPPTIDDPNGSIVISVLTRENDDPATPVGAAELLYDEVLISPSGTGVGNRRFFVAMQLGSPFSTTSITWNISNPGDRWFEATFVVRPAKLYYIQDDDSITAYGERKLPISLGTFIKLQNTSENIANAMYDFAVDYIIKHKDPTLFYNFSVVHLPLNPLEWSFGQTMRVIYQDADEQIDEDLIATERTQEFDENGVRMWRITFSDKVQFRIDDRGVWFLDQLKARVAAIQINQT